MWRNTLRSAYRRSRRERRRRRCGLVRENDTRQLSLEPLEQRRLLASDFGDAPNDGPGSLPDYPVTLAQNGAWHNIVPGFYLGTQVDAETDGQPSAEANADDLTATPDDEDGVTNVGGGGVMITGGLKRGDPAATLQVLVTNDASVAHPYLDAWIDFNMDGDWGDPGERILSQPVTADENELTFAVPDDAVLGLTYARFRLHSATGPGLPPTGLANAGEVEDHRVVITFDVTNPDQVDKLLAADATVGQELGISVAISGNTAVVGSLHDDHAGTESGSAYVFTRSDGGWTQQAKLTATDATTGAWFGRSVAVWGDTVVVGAQHDDQGGTNSGSAYVFTRDASSWMQQAKLIAADATPGDRFGRSVAVSGDTAVLGALFDDNDGATDAGSAYVFFRAGSSWTQQAKLTAAESDAGNRFGVSVAVSGDTAIVGARGDEDLSSVNTGSAHVFTRNGGIWTQQASLTAAESDPGHRFGHSVAVSGDTAIVGAFLDDAGGADTGSAYIFGRSGDAWSQQAKLTADDAAAGDQFGVSVAVSGDTAVVGAFLDDDGGAGSGSAYIFVRSGDTWSQQSKLIADDAAAGDRFGHSVAVSGDLAIMGADLDDETGTDSGAAYIFDLSPTKDFGDAPDGLPGTGSSNYQTLSTDGGPSHTIVPGLFMGGTVDGEAEAMPNLPANGDDTDGALPDDEDGVACPMVDLVLTEGAAPTVNVIVTNTTGNPATLYGWVDYNQDGIFDNTAEKTSVSVSNSPGSQTVTLVFPSVPEGCFGATYARLRLGLTSDAAAAYATGAAGRGEVEDYPVSIMLRSDGHVQDHQKIGESDGDFGGQLDNYDWFAGSIAVLGDLDNDGVVDVAVKADGDDDGGPNHGAVWVLFMNADGTVKRHQKITENQGGFTGRIDNFDYFGSSVTALDDLDGDGVADLAVGAFYDDDGGAERGAVWILFMNSDGTVRAYQKISDTQGGFAGGLRDTDHFGRSVAALGDVNGDGIGDLAVGAYADDDGGTDRGAVWILLLDSDGTVKGHRKISSKEGNFTGTLDDGNLFGWSITAIGDMDANGVTDLAVGAHRDDDGGTNRGAVWILFLNPGGTVKNHQKIGDSEGNFTGTLDDGDGFGYSLATIGDLDGDSVTDLAVGAYRDDDGGTNRGAVWVLFMNPGGTVKNHQKISDTEGNFSGTLEDGDGFGSSLAMLGDLDGDGVTNLGVGAVGDNGDGGLQRGAMWVLNLAPVVTTGEIRGSKWNDWDGDGQWDDGEPGLGGWKIYVDENQNGVWEDGEPFGVTGVDGSYAITELPAGTHRVREVSQPHWTQVVPVSTHVIELQTRAVVAGVDFGNRANGLFVTELLPTPSGFIARFSRPIDTADLSLYDVEAGTFGAADVTLVGDTVDTVRGSIIAGTDSLTFVATGGPIPADDYRVVLRSAANGFKDSAGELLDGDYDGSAGGDFIGQVTVDAVEDVVISLPDFGRGPGQPVNVLANDIGVPLTLTDNRIGGVAIQSLVATLSYDPTLLSVTGATLGPDAPADAVLLVDLDTVGQVTLSLSNVAVPLEAGHLVSLTADVPWSVGYGEPGVLSLSEVQVEDLAGSSVAATSDEAIHVTAYFGDTTGNGGEYPSTNPYSGLDAQRAARVAVGLDEGLEAYPSIDPIVIADVTANNDISGLDAQRISQEAVGLDPWEIPRLPRLTQEIVLPATASAVSTYDAGFFEGGLTLDFAADGTINIVGTTGFDWITNPDGSLVRRVNFPGAYSYANVGATNYPTVGGGDGVNHYLGGGANYDTAPNAFFGGFGFAGKETTDTTDLATIRFGAIVGTFTDSPLRDDWFDIGYGASVTVPDSGARLYLAINDGSSNNNTGDYLVTIRVSPPIP